MVLKNYLKQKYMDYRGTLVVASITLSMIIPLLAIIWLALSPEENLWGHLFETILPRYTQNTLIFMLGTGLLSLILGTVSAWLVTVVEIPGRKFLQIALLLPFAIPSYVVAFVYTEFLEYSGPVQSLYRSIFSFENASQYSWFNIRSLGGAIYVVSIVLYPYVYMMARVAFSQQAVPILETGRVLGKTPWQCFYKLGIPLARPAIVAGVMLVMMETLNDFGTVSLFGVHTLTSGVYDMWLGMGDVGSAAQLALLMVAMVFILLYMESIARKKDYAFSSNSLQKKIKLLKLNRFGTIMACVFCYGLIGLGFGIPVAILIEYSLRYFHQSLSTNIIDYIINSVMLAAGSSIIVVLLGTILAYSLRLSNKKSIAILTRLSCLGYATPGAVLALGILIPFASADLFIDTWSENTFGIRSGAVLSGGVFILFFAYTVRFINIGLGSMQSSLHNISRSMDCAARVFGRTPFGVLKEIHFPLLRSGLMAGAIIVFVDTIKELPATLLLRPFDFETLATYVYQYAGDELIEQASLGALVIVIAGILPVFMLSIVLDKKT